MIKKRVGLLLSLFVFILSSHTASANPFFLSNDILVLNPNDGLSVCSTSLNVTGSSNVEIVLKVLTSAGMSLEQAAGVAGNLVVESASETINPAAEEFPGQDRGGKGVVQWTAGRWRGPDGLREFSIYRVKSEAERLGVKYDEAAQSLGVTVGAEWSDMTTQMEFMLWEVGQGAAWNGKPGGTEQRGWQATIQEKTPSAAAETWMLTYERPGTPHLDRRIAAANRIYQQFSGQQLGEVTIGADNCGGGVVAGNITSTAKNLAWLHKVSIKRGTSDRYGEDVAKPEYVKAVEEVHSSINQAMFTDCGVFVSTVMRSSGVDPEYPLRGTSTQLPYVLSSSKYKTFTAQSESELQPGDIMIRDGHTYIYVGSYTAPEDNKEYKAVGASWYTRPPSGHDLYLSGEGNGDISTSSAFTVARYIGG